jgi:hypothetical protein
MYEEHLEGRKDRSYALWAFWMLERWAQLQGKNTSLESGRAPGRGGAARIA